VDESTRTLAYTVVEGDPRYANFTAEVHFEPKGETQTEATWTAKYDPVGDAGPPEHVKNISILIFKAFEKAIQAKRTTSHTETLDASPDAIWRPPSSPRLCLTSSSPSPGSRAAASLAASASAKWALVCTPKISQKHQSGTNVR
jgi:hypothetical protein